MAVFFSGGNKARCEVDSQRLGFFPIVGKYIDTCDFLLDHLRVPRRSGKKETLLELSARLQSFRERAGLTQQQAAFGMGWPISRIDRLESGTMLPSDTDQAFSADAQSYESFLNKKVGRPVFIPPYLRENPTPGK